LEIGSSKSAKERAGSIPAGGAATEDAVCVPPTSASADTPPKIPMIVLSKVYPFAV
jgi:hypothetical protein